MRFFWVKGEYAEGVSWNLANFQAVFGNLTGEDARPTLWRGRPRPRLQFGHFQRFITALVVDILGRGGLNHGGVANDVGRGALAEGLGLNLFAQECYQVLAGGTPSGTAPLG